MRRNCPLASNSSFQPHNRLPKSFNALALVFIVSLVAVVSARASTLTVTNAADSGAGTLRDRVSSAVSGDVIVFTNMLAGQTILLTSGEILLNKNLTIDGSALSNGIAIDGNNAGRIFNVASGTTNVLSALTITNGHAGFGGGVINQGALTLNRCTVVRNSALEGGGGIDSESGTLTLKQCTLTGNSVFGSGAGIFNFTGVLRVIQCTLTENVGTGDGYGGGGGINNYAGTMFVSNSIIAANFSPNSPNIYGLFTGANNLTDGSPQLAPLGNYGGQMITMPPLPGSPAVDAGDESAASQFSTDQRGFARRVGLQVDIGAVEGVYVADYNGPGPFENAALLGDGAFQFSFTNYSDMSLTVWASTDVALPFNQWSNLGAPVESPAGAFTFTDPQATNSVMRFYRVSSP